MNQVATRNKGDIMESVVVKGDISKLTPEERTIYYMKVCESSGLNPLTKPFEYITLNGKLTLYARRDATDQLRQIHGVSVVELTESEREGVFVVTAKVQNAQGRTDIAKGAVNISGLKGDNLANALMKAETKAKRRATLSICGLGLLDETELETIPGAKMQDITPAEASPLTPFKTAALRKTFQENTVKAFHEARSMAELETLATLSKDKFDLMEASGDERDEMSLVEMRKQYGVAMKRLKDGKQEESEEQSEENGYYVKGEFDCPPVHQEETPAFLRAKPNSA